MRGQVDWSQSNSILGVHPSRRERILALQGINRKIVLTYQKMIILMTTQLVMFVHYKPLKLPLLFLVKLGSSLESQG